MNEESNVRPVGGAGTAVSTSLSVCELRFGFMAALVGPAGDGASQIESLPAGTTDYGGELATDVRVLPPAVQVTTTTIFVLLSLSLSSYSHSPAHSLTRSLSVIPSVQGCASWTDILNHDHDTKHEPQATAVSPLQPDNQVLLCQESRSQVCGAWCVRVVKS